MRIKFTEDALYETEGYNKGHTFKKGEVHDFTDRPDFAQRWISRGKAVAIDDVSKFKPITRATSKDDRVAEAQAEPLPEDLEKLTKAELEELAASRGVDLSDARTKAEIIAKLESPPSA